MACCCSKWWQGPAIFSISVILAFIAISTALHFTSKDSSSSSVPPNKPINDELSINASKALRKAGFNIMSTFLQVSPELFLITNQNLTIFAIEDSVFSNTSIPPWLLNNLLQYHTSSFKLSMEDLLHKPQDSCFPTLYRAKNIAITKVDSKARLVEINNVQVSHPDIFLGKSISVHGVLGPFSPIDPRSVRQQGWDRFIQSPTCEFLESNQTAEWRRVIRTLSSKGFISFAIGLQSALDGILEEHRTLNSATIFAPSSFRFVSSPSSLLKRVVKFHLLPQRLSYKELASFPARTLIRTLVPDQNLEVTGVLNFMQGLIINGVEIVSPEIFRSDKFVIHGISQAFQIAELPHTSR